MKGRSIFLGFLLGGLAVFLGGTLFPPLTLDFWRLAFAKEVQFSFIGIDGGISSQTMTRTALEQSASAEVSLRLLFLVGTNSAKCHAVVGLRHLRAGCYREYLDRLKASKESVDVHWMDMAESTPLSLMAKHIGNGQEDLISGTQRDFYEWRQKKFEETARKQP